MFEDNDLDDPQDIEHEDDQFFAALTLLLLAIICLGIYLYYLLTVGVYGPPL